jgi:uncharacterized membrane protein
MNPHHQKERAQFQVERIAFFSDALVAIAVTLLVIEIKAPQIESGSTMKDQMNQFVELVPQFISFIVSFAIIISQWMRHHDLFGLITNYDRKLIVLNSFFLFMVTIIPFSTSYFAHNDIQRFSLPFIVYGFSLISLSVFNYLLFRHAVKNKNNLLDKPMSASQVKWLTADYLLFPVAIFTGLLMGAINFKLGLFVYVVLMQLGFYINKKRGVKIKK